MKTRKQLEIAINALKKVSPPFLGYEHEEWRKSYDSCQKALKDIENVVFSKEKALRELRTWKRERQKIADEAINQVYKKNKEEIEQNYDNQQRHTKNRKEI